MTLYEQLFYNSLRIRKVEERIIDIYPSDKIQSPVHLSIGQEAIATGLCQNLENRDLLYASYRCHAYYLAKGGSMKKMFAELYGKVTGCARGKGGSMHLAEKEVGFMGSSAIVGSTISHAVGSALASKKLNKQQVCITVFGDGATEEGSFHESLNFASAFKLPVVFICENNGLAIHSHIGQRQSYRISEIAKSYGLTSVKIENGFDLMETYNGLKGCVEHVRKTGLPTFVEINTYRYKEHVGIADDHNAGYRDRKQLDTWMASDPLIHREDLVARFSAEIEDEIEGAVRFAEESPFPPYSELLNDVY